MLKWTLGCWATSGRCAFWRSRGPKWDMSEYKLKMPVSLRMVSYFSQLNPTVALCPHSKLSLQWQRIDEYNGLHHESHPAKHGIFISYCNMLSNSKQPINCFVALPEGLKLKSNWLLLPAIASLIFKVTGTLHTDPCQIHGTSMQIGRPNFTDYMLRRWLLNEEVEWSLWNFFRRRQKFDCMYFKSISKAIAFYFLVFEWSREGLESLSIIYWSIHWWRY